MHKIDVKELNLNDQEDNDDVSYDTNKDFLKILMNREKLAIKELILDNTIINISFLENLAKIKNLSNVVTIDFSNSIIIDNIAN